MESITGPITRIISRDGMLGVYNQFNDAGKLNRRQIRVVSMRADSSPAEQLSY